MEYHSIHDPTILLRSLHTYCRYMWPICWGTAPAIPSLQQNLSMCHFWPLFAPVTVTTRFLSVLVRLTYKVDLYVPLDVLDCKKPLHFNTDHTSCIYFIFRQTFEFVKSDRSVTTITHMWIVVRMLHKVDTSKRWMYVLSRYAHYINPIVRLSKRKRPKMVPKTAKSRLTIFVLCRHRLWKRLRLH